MTTTFMGLEIGKRSVLMHQTALNITGHNVANANTAGYTRQVPDIVTTSPWCAPMLVNTTGAGQLGTGVDIAYIQRMRDSFIDAQIRQENKTGGYWTKMQESLDKIEVILNEPSDDGLREVMDQFWASWQDVSSNPESEAVRAVVSQRGMAMAEAFNHTYRQLTELREDVNAEIRIRTKDVNAIAKQIAELNQQILAISVAGKQPNDLMDKRDLLIDDVSKLADIKVHEDINNMIALQLGDRMLVDGVTYRELDTTKDDQSMYMVIWKDTQMRAQINGGEMRGLLDVRGKTNLEQEVVPSEYKEVIPIMIDQLNKMAKSVILKTNELHRGGYSLNNKTAYPDNNAGVPNNFFVPPDDPENLQNWAQFMEVRAEIELDPKNIAAASSRTWDQNGNKLNFGDGSNALKIAELKHDLNNVEYDLKTQGININLADTAPLSFIIDDGNDTNAAHTITLNPPNTFSDMQSLVKEIQQQLDEKELAVKVRSDGLELFFYSDTVSDLDIINPDSGIQDIQKNNLQSGAYQIQTVVNQPGAADAILQEIQSYNQKTAKSIFGSGSIGTVTNAATLDINASIELTVTAVDPASGQVAYNYVSHEYNRDGTYTERSGTLMLHYSGLASQIVSIGGLNFQVSGLDEKNNVDAAELKVGDKGILNLTAAAAAATDYQQVDIAFDFNNPSMCNHRFIFNDTVLDGTTTKLNFFTLNAKRNNEFFGRSYNGSIDLNLNTGTLATASTASIPATAPAAYFSYYKEPLENNGMVQTVTIDDYWRTITADIGVQSQESQRMVKNQQTLLNELENKRQSVSGVSMDEEMTNMIRFQQAYNAAARFITTIDEALNTIINGMGVVGR
ncbi:MAG: flagellar hook-associated protein FlgK [Syntrophomonas sp.]|nr:flagellar hook-associated protein FlgK [Syntrophomonas sp.]